MRRSPGRCVLLLCLSVVVLSVAVSGQLSGRLGLDLVARRIPTTVTGEIKLDTPSEFTMLEFAIASSLDLTLTTGFIDPHVQAVVNTAGLEHCVLSSPFNFGDLPLFETQFDELKLVPEIWVAVPFQNAIDVNGLPNSVVVPPGDPLFVSARTTISASVAGFNIDSLIMLEDANFPSPSSTYDATDPLVYDHGDQEFALGSLTTVSWRGSIGWSMNAQVGLGASGSSKSIKGHSARGKVTPESSFVRIGVGGIHLASISLYGVGIQDVVLGSSFSVATGTEETFGTTISISGSAWEGSSIGMSITLTSDPPTVSALTLSVTEGPFRMSIALDTLSVTGLSASCGNSLSLGPISGSWSISASGIERGLTGLAMRLALAEGVFSTNTGITFSQRGDDFGFASWSNRLTFRFSPAVVSVQATFGRYGLTRAAVTTSVSF